MLGSTCFRDLVCATQQGVRHIASWLDARGSGAFPRGSAIALLSVALLCGAANVREFEISIRDRRVERGAPTLRVKRGETVLLRWRTDEAVSLHVHGYDLRMSLSSASPGIMRFEAGIAGRFPVAAHEFGGGADRDARSKTRREVTLLYLEVLPE
jgi:hypothetical protein